MNTLTPQQRIERAHAQIMRHEATVLYSSILMVGDVQFKDDLPTAATNGRDVFYNPEFVESLTQQELVFLVLHENGHKVYQQLSLWKGLWKENAQLANMAADYVVNLPLAALAKKYPQFIRVPSMALVDQQYSGMDTQEVFNKLKQNGAGAGGSLDEHKLEELSEIEEQSLSEEILDALRQGQLLSGKMNGTGDLDVSALLEPKIDWREQLREFVSAVCVGRDDSTWRRPNRRWLHQDTYMPSAVSETLGSIAIVLDTSGSISRELVSCFLSEVVGVCNQVQPELIHLIECDAKVQRHEVYDASNQHAIADIKTLKGGGGTDMVEALEYIERNRLNPEVTLVLTDGYTPFPNTLARPTLWAITTNIVAPIGVTIRMVHVP